MPEGWDFSSAVTVRLGIVAGGILGGLGGYRIEMMSAPAGGMRTWPVVLGAAVGLGTAWAVLTWLARRHKGAGVIAGGVITLAAVVALLAWFAWQ